MTVFRRRQHLRCLEVVIIAALFTGLSAQTQATGIGIHSDYLSIDHGSYTGLDDSDSLRQESRQHRFNRWMRIQDSRDVRSYTLNTRLGNGIDNRLDFRHSQIELYDQDHWNPEARLFSATQIQLVQRAGDVWFHAAGSFTDSESHYRTGLSVGRFSVAASAGYGTGFARLAGDRSDLNPWFFHGGSSARYDFSGTTIGLSLTNSTELEGGVLQLLADGLEARKAKFLSIHQSTPIMNIGVRLYDFSRGPESIARSLQFVAQHKTGAIGFRDFRHNNGARQQELNLSYTGLRKGQVGLRLRRNTNPLFGESENSSAMLTFAGRIGNRTGREFSIDEKSDDAADNESHRVRNSVLVGLGVVASVAVSSSGSAEMDNAVRYPREEGAAFAMAQAINPTCVRENREYGAWIYRNQDSSFSHLPLRRGAELTVNFGSTRAIPSGSSATAAYHCHGNARPNYDKEIFSSTDIRTLTAFAVNGYISTPTGAFKKYSVATGTTEQIGTVAVE